MNETNLTLSTSHKLLPFLKSSESVKGIESIKLITDALSAPGVYVFTELYESSNIIEASSLPEVVPYYSLLQLFLYGTYHDYQVQAKSGQLPTLNEAQINKLKHLSIVTLSESNQTLTYDLLQSNLDIPTVRELEDLIIDAFYQGIFTGKLDQRQRQLQIMFCMGRDLRPQQIDETIQVLDSWSTNTTRLLGALDAKIADLQEAVQSNNQAQEEFSHKIESLRSDINNEGSNLKNTILSSFDESRKKGYGSSDYMSSDYKERVKKR